MFGPAGAVRAGEPPSKGPSKLNGLARFRLVASGQRGAMAATFKPENQGGARVSLAQTGALALALQGGNRSARWSAWLRP